jgi:hypothetical protein
MTGRAAAARVAALALALAAGCRGRGRIGSCDDDLGGEYADGSGARWMILDNGGSLEAYPLFDDFQQRAGAARGETSASCDPLLAGCAGMIEVAPRAIDLHRPRLAGDVRRRYTRYPGGAACTARTPLRLTACADDRLELVVTDSLPPLTYQPCSYPPGASHVERWTRR